MSEPWMLCPSCEEAHVVEGYGRDSGRYHCPRCMRCVPVYALAWSAYQRGMTAGMAAFNAALEEAKLREKPLPHQPHPDAHQQHEQPGGDQVPAKPSERGSDP